MVIAQDRAASGLEILRCSAWEENAWLVHGFSTRPGGVSAAYASPDCGGGALNLGFTAEDERGRVEQNRRLFVQALNAQSSRLCTLRQVHSNRVLKVGFTGVDAGESGDGMITDDPGLLLAIQTADCVPILLLDRKRRVIAALHAGWRGTVERIAETGVGRMFSEFGSRAEDISAAIGPCIRSCCYEVGQDVRNDFSGCFAYAETLFTAVGKSNSCTSLHLDLVEANRRQLMTAGLNWGAIHVVGECTSCHPERFFSYRKSGGSTGRLMSVIGLL